MTRIADVYARALYDLARDEGLDGEILEQLAVLGQAFAAEPEYLRLLSAPAIPKQERCGMVDEGFRGKVHRYVLSFMKLLTEKGCVRCFPDCCRAYREFYNEDHGILPVKAVTAVPLTKAQAERLTKKLCGLTGKTVTLQNVVEPACMGGVRLDYDGKRVDDTIAHRLEAVHSLLKNTIL